MEMMNGYNGYPVNVQPVTVAPLASLKTSEVIKVAVTPIRGYFLTGKASPISIVCHTCNTRIMTELATSQPCSPCCCDPVQHHMCSNCGQHIATVATAVSACSIF